MKKHMTKPQVDNSQMKAQQDKWTKEELVQVKNELELYASKRRETFFKDCNDIKEKQNNKNTRVEEKERPAYCCHQMMTQTIH